MRKLNLGCGKKIKEGYTNADIARLDGVDQVFDFNFFPYPFSANEFDEILADNILEHLDDIPAVIKELHRISKPNSTIRIIVPYYNCYGAANDVTHKHYFSHLSFEPFYNPNTRGNYFIQEQFKLKSMRLIPTRLGKIFLFDFIQLPLSFVFGQIIQTIDIVLIVKK
jgi:SAM-dependent methyltransferase